MVGEDIDQDLVSRFLSDPVVRSALPTHVVPCVCTCRPLINLGARKRPYGDRIVLIGDSGVTRLYKDGIGAAFRTAKAAAETAVFNGIAAADFERHFWPVCRSIARDNAVGRIMFATNTVMKNSRLTRRAMMLMAEREQRVENANPHMSALLWNMFTGSAPYTEMFRGTFHPGFIFNLLRSLLASFGPRGRGASQLGGEARS
jgi:flavin-dependent dehydrogenase